MVTPLFGWNCDSIDEHPDGVHLSLTGAEGRSRTVTARYLVGSDGARSSVRRHIGSTLSGATYRQRWLIVDLAATRERLRHTRVVCNPDRPLITLPGSSDGAQAMQAFAAMVKDLGAQTSAAGPAPIKCARRRKADLYPVP